MYRIGAFHFHFIFCVVTIFSDDVSDAAKLADYEEVVYLKNGEVRRGIIIESVPNEHVKIMTNDGNVYRYDFDAIKKITKERPINPDSQLESSIKPRKKKYPPLAVLLGFFVPGSGHLYVGSWHRGLSFLLTEIFLINGLDDAGSLAAIVRVAGMIDAYRQALQHNRGKPRNAGNLSE